jgi:hypothetical protein
MKDGRRLEEPSRVVFETESALSGRIRVVDQGDERRLVASGHTLSAISLSGDWSRLKAEYWCRALDMVELPRRPTALFVGLGGGNPLKSLVSILFGFILAASVGATATGSMHSTP